MTPRLRISAFALILSLVVIAMCSASGALAQPRIVQTDCDTLSLEPPLVEIEFGIINTSEFQVCGLSLDPIQSGSTPADSCRILDCASPPDWACSPGWWDAQLDASGELACIPPGQNLGSFRITLDPLFCCYQARFFAAGVPVPFFEDTVCFECEKPVDVEPGSWGGLKSRYR